MKRAIVSVLAVLALLSALVPLTAWQNTPTLGVLPDSGPTLPATCSIPQIYFKTTATTGLSQCGPANTWTALVAGAGGLPAHLSYADPTLTVSAATFGSGQVALSGNTSGTATITAPAVAGTATNAVTSSNWFSAPNFTASGAATSNCNAMSNGLQMTVSSNTGVTSFGSNAVDICANATRVTQVSSGGVSLLTGVIGFSGGKGQHFTTQAANNDHAGVVSGTTTTAVVTFTTNYTSTPACVATPTTAGVTSFIITSQANSGFTITYAPSGATNFNYVCVGNPN